MSPWWETFFEGNFADFFLERDKKATKTITRFLIKKLSLKKGMTVFDQCCGTGGLSFALAEKGISTIGVDQSPSYIAHAKKKAKRRGLNCTFHRDDAFLFISPKKCDAAVN
ncbi:MAG: methyltransferase domain-containing protein [bacterium]|nr:methyltransferase domain-containing protein [bacterium]